MKHKPRFKIDAIPAFSVRYDMEEEPSEYTVALYRRRWFGWKRLAIFKDRSAARVRLREIENLPEYF